MPDEEKKIEKRKWFKFYGSDYLLDPKMMELSPIEKIMWVTLMCLASANGEDGWVRHINDVRLASFAGVPGDVEKSLYQGVLEHFKTLNMIEIKEASENIFDVFLIHFEDRQNKNLSPYERLRKHRAKGKEEKEEKITPDKIRVDKKREDIDTIFDSYEKIFGKEIKAKNSTRVQQIKARLSSFSLEEILKAFQNGSQDKFLCGDNEGGKFYATVDYFIRNDANIEKYLSGQTEEKEYYIKDQKVSKEEYEEYKKEQGI